MELDISGEIEAINAQLEALIDSLPDLISDHVANTPNIPFELSDEAIDSVLSVAKDANNEVRLKVLERMRDLVDSPTDLDAIAVQQSFDDVMEFYIRKTAQESANRIQSAAIARQIVDDRDVAIANAVDVSKRVALDISESEIYASSALFSIATSLENGYSYFRYEIVGDQSVRDSHRSRQGKIFRYGAQRVTADVPKLEHNCRCEDFPLSDEEVLDNLDQFYYPEDAPTGVAAMARNFEIKSRGNSISIIGDIDEMKGNDFASYKSKVEAIRQGSDEPEIINYITSRGGDALDGIDAFDYLKSIGNRVITHVTGYVGSAATYWVAASDYSTIDYHGQVLVHESSVCGCFKKGDGEMIDSVANVVDEIQVDMYVHKTGKERNIIEALMSKDEPISAQEALEFGLIDEIRGETQSTALAQVHNFNEDLTMSEKEKLEQLEQEIVSLKAANVKAEAEANEVADLQTELVGCKATIAALEKQLEDANSVDIDAEVDKKIAAEKVEKEALADARERVQALGVEAKGDTANEVFAQATKELGIHEEGYDSNLSVVAFKAFEKANAKSTPSADTDLGASFIGSNEKERTETRAERIKRLNGGQ